MLCVLAFFASCTSDDTPHSGNASIIGVWKLSAWNVDEGFDINNDGIANTNLLNEIDCSRNETLFFDDKGVVSLNTTFSPDISIALLNQESPKYHFNVECDTEGIISLAASYSVNDSVVLIGESEATIKDGKISLVFKDKIKIYNQGFSQVIDAKDLTLVYVKQ